jgi:diguanylate cyclase (GGDEF)-like protein
MTNIIVLVGATSFIYWLDLQENPPALICYRKFIKVLLATLFLTYLYGESWVNTNIGPHAFGLHWTFLNMLIVIMFVLNIQFGIWWQPVIESILVAIYLLLYTTSWSFSILGCYLLFFVFLWLPFLKRHTIKHHRWAEYLLLYLFAGSMLLLVNMMHTSERLIIDGYFWLRQLSALVILGIVAIEYIHLLNRSLQQNRHFIEQATIDGLTQLKNFASFDHDLRAHFQQYQAQQREYLVYEIDIDHFKRINDHYGHLVGNQILIQVAQELKQCAQTSPFQTMAYRLGGEEFGVIVAGDLTTKAVSEIAEHFKQRLLDLEFPDIDPQLTITASIGQATIHPDHYSYNDTYKNADRNLYHAKQHGRNRITLETD